MRSHTLLRLGAVAAVCFAGVIGSRAQDSAPKAGTILQQMAAAYSAAQSYSDKSVAKYQDLDGSERLTVNFRIWFARPSSFRVDAESHSPRGGLPRREVIWTDGSAVRTWASDKPVKTQEKVRLAGSGMFGTYAYHVPTLLEGSYGAAQRLHELSSPTLVGEEAVEGIDCHHVRGDWNGDTYDVWIGKADHLVRKIQAKYTDHQLEEIHREIAVDQPITLKEFRFAPEEEVRPANPSPKPKSTPKK